MVATERKVEILRVPHRKLKIDREQRNISHREKKTKNYQALLKWTNMFVLVRLIALGLTSYIYASEEPILSGLLFPDWFSPSIPSLVGSLLLAIL